MRTIIIVINDDACYSGGEGFFIREGECISLDPEYHFYFLVSLQIFSTKISSLNASSKLSLFDLL